MKINKKPGVISNNTNQMVLNSSIICTTIFSFIAVTIGILSSSQVILFDGIYNVVGVISTIPSILAIKFIKKQDMDNYPFGKETFEPFIVILQYCFIIYICISNITIAIEVILGGGHVVNIHTGVLYGLVSSIYDFTVYRYLKVVSNNQSTAIAKVEIDNWRFSMLISIGIMLGFGLSWLLSRTNLNIYMPYVDPSLTILVTLIFFKTPIVAIKSGLRELLHAKPSEEITNSIIQIIDKVNQSYDCFKYTLRTGKVGNKVIIEIDYVINKESKMDSVLKQDQLRDSLVQHLTELPFEKWMNINFTGDVRWSKHMFE